MGKKNFKNRVELDIILQFLFDRYFDSSGGRAGERGRGGEGSNPLFEANPITSF